MSFTHKSEQSTPRTFRRKHRFEHWYRDNQVYFITARVARRRPAFASERAKRVFWDAFDRYTGQAGYTPWITCLLDNHYHTLGYLGVGLNLPRMMKGLHGVTAKRVNDLRESEAGGIESEAGGINSTCLEVRDARIKPFWSDNGHKTYFDGCIRDALQARRAYRYIQIQPRRHGVMAACEAYPHTRIGVALDVALDFGTRHRAYLEGVAYKRYQRPL